MAHLRCPCSCSDAVTAAIAAGGLPLLLLLLAALCGLLASTQAAVSSPTATVQSALRYSQEACEPKFWFHSRTHTACLVPRDPPSELSPGDRRLIVDLHNKYRAGVEQLPGQPPAADMQAMVWDDDLARLATKWVSLCKFEHDRGTDRSIPGSYEVGQNLAMGDASWSQVVTLWWQEGASFSYGSSAAEGSNKPSTGHYVQMVWAASSRVGCASTSCGAAGTMFGCNYAHAAGVGSQRWLPYQRGAKGSACPSFYNATMGLCDCKGKICKNDGVLDLKTCQCRCPGRAPWVQPSDCSVNCSLAEDRKVCSTQGGGWDGRYCQSYGNVKYEYCPTMCGICPAKASRPAPLATAKSTPSAAWTPEVLDEEEEDEDSETKGETEDTGAGEEAEEEGEEEEEAESGVESEEHAEEEEDDEGAAGGSEEDGRGDGEEQGEEEEEENDYERDDLPRCTTVDDASCVQVSHLPSRPDADHGRTTAAFGAVAAASADGSSRRDQCQQPNHACPAMCGQCLATMCKDLTGRPRFIGDTWTTASGLHVCSEQGVSVSKGCITANRVDVIPIGEQRNDTWNGIVYSCVCNVITNVLKLSCTPFGRAAVTQKNSVPDAATTVPSEETSAAAATAASSSPPPPRCLHQDPPFCGSAVFARMAVHVRCMPGTRCPAACGHCLGSDTHPSYSAFLKEVPSVRTSPVTTVPTSPLASRGRGQHIKQTRVTRGTSSPLTTATQDEEDEAETDAADCAGAEPARCGQPSARGFFLPAQCRHMAVQQSCPAMCKLCRATACLDYSGRRYAVGESWVSDFAQLRCTPAGVTAEKGCFFTQLRQFIAAGTSKNFTDGPLHYSCNCLIDDDQTTLDCTRTLLVTGSAMLLTTPTPSLSSTSQRPASRLPHGTGRRMLPTVTSQQGTLPVTAGVLVAAMPQPRGRSAQSPEEMVPLTVASAPAAVSTTSSSPALVSSSSLPRWRAHLTISASPVASVSAAVPPRLPSVELRATSFSAAVTTTVQVPAAAAIPSSDAPALPACSQAEGAKCGQPSSSGYYTASQCRHPTVLRLCPAMCGKCTALACKDYSDQTHTTGQSWVYPGFGRMSCTDKGIAVEDGCYLKSRDAFVPTNRSYEYTEQGMVLSCLCERMSPTQLRMSCKTKT